MVASAHTQSLSDFREKAIETIDRMNRTGEAEILTVNGEAKAVLLPPAVYNALAREALATRDAVAIERSLQEIREGKAQEAGEFFDELRANLLAMKTSQRGREEG